MWNGGFKYGLKVTFIQLFITYILVRFVLMPFTNFSIANLGIMYEAVAASIIAAPKAYIILVITAFLASRANLKYGWEFNGIMLPALLALQLLQPSKILTSFIETAVILGVGGSLIHFTRLKHAHIEGARLLMLFFTIGFIFKLILNYIVVWFFPTVKVTDTFIWLHVGHLTCPKDLSKKCVRPCAKSHFSNICCRWKPCYYCWLFSNAYPFFTNKTKY